MTRPPERMGRIMDLLYAAWTMYPDMRFGQLIQNILGDTPLEDAYQWEEDRWFKAISDFLAEFASHLAR